MPTQPRNVYTLDSIMPPHAQESLRHLELYARRIVEGMLHGIHKSRRKGVSTEFDHHKLYQPGDPLKHIDWKVSARHDRHYVKRYIEDTSLAVRLVVDRSRSMLQATEDAPSKYLQAARVAACLAYLILNQRDGVGMALTTSDETLWLPVQSTEAHLVRILQALASRQPAAADSLQPCLKTILDRGERKGMVAVVSDFLFDPLPTRQQIARLGAQGHEVLLLQVRDATEEEFPFNRWVQFESLEDASVRHRLDAVPLKKIYLEEYQNLIEEWRSWCKRHDFHFVSLRAEDAAETAISQYLALRTEMGRS